MQTSKSTLRHRRKLESGHQTNNGIKSDTVTWVRLQNKACLRIVEGDTITSTESQDPTKPFLCQSCKVVHTHVYKAKSVDIVKLHDLKIMCGWPHIIYFNRQAGGHLKFIPGP